MQLRFLSISLVALLVVLGLSTTKLEVQATTLPAGLIDYLKVKDSKVRLRFDGLVLFSNGKSYVPVFPQGYNANLDPVAIQATIPDRVQYPDVIHFDNDLYLLRLIPTTTGKLTLPRLSTYPLSLKTGLVPQDFIVPNNLSIPTELRAVLGSIPYALPKALDDNVTPLAEVREGFESKKQKKQAPRALYLADLLQQRIMAYSPTSGLLKWELKLDCLPSDLQLSPNGENLYVSCLTTNEALVVDTQAALVKARVNTAQKPVHLQLLPFALNPVDTESTILVSADKANSTLSLVDTRKNLKVAEIELPGRPSALATRLNEPVIYAAEASKAEIYEVEFQKNRVLRVLNKTLLPDLNSHISSLYFEPPQPTVTNETGKATPVVNDLGRLWVTSRTSNTVQVIDVLSQKLTTIPVGSKPVAIQPVGKKQIAVLCADAARIELIDKEKLERLQPIALESGSFPSTFAIEPQGRFAYVSLAADERLAVVDLRKREITQQWREDLRGLAMAYYSQAPTQLESLIVPVISRVDNPDLNGGLTQPEQLAGPSLTNNNDSELSSSSRKVDSDVSTETLYSLEPVVESSETAASEQAKTEPESGNPAKPTAPGTPAQLADPTPSQTEPERRRGWWPFGRHDRK